MPAAYTDWTLNPHGPLEKLEDNLWYVSGTMNGGRVRRCMTLARLRDGRIVADNPIALEDELLVEIGAWGEIAALVVPNAYHRMDARIVKDRYPAARVYAPAGAAKAVEKVVPVDGSYADIPADDTVAARHLAGMRDKEGVIEIRSGDVLTTVFCDSVLNVPAQGFPMNVFLGPTGVLSVPRVVRWLLLRDARALRDDLVRIAESDGLARLVPGHGAILDAPAAALREAAARL